MILRVLLRSCLHGVCVSGELVEWGVDESAVSGGSIDSSSVFSSVSSSMLNECARCLAL